MFDGEMVLSSRSMRNSPDATTPESQFRVTRKVRPADDGEVEFLFFFHLVRLLEITIETVKESILQRVSCIVQRISCHEFPRHDVMERDKQ